MRIHPALAAVALTGCVTTVDAALDLDQDGLLSDAEFRNGTDPNNPDSDGDGHLDGEEVFAFTDPLSPADHPYTGGWALGACRHDAITPTGDRPGDVTADFELVDQFGDTLKLYDFCDRTVLLVSAGQWCGSCQAEAPIVQQWYRDLEAQGFLPITLLGEDWQGNPASSEHAAQWAESYGLEHPVVADPNWTVTYRYVEGTFGLPSMHLLGPGAEVIEVQALLDRSDITDNLPQ